MPSISTFFLLPINFIFMLVLHISSLSLKCGILCIKTATYMFGANSDTFKLDNGRGERACLITLHSNFEIFLKGHPAVDIKLDRRIFER